MSEEFLRECFDRFKCDKGFKHGYEYVYAHAIEQVRARFGCVIMLELGVFKGASSRAFSLYMSDLDIDHQIHGVDLFERVSIRDVMTACSQFKDIHLAKDDTQDPKLSSPSGALNLIIDDAQHTPAANRKTLHNYWQHLVPGGVYFIEDVWPLDEMTDEERNHWWLRKHAGDYTMKKYEEFLKECRMCDPLFEEIDLRSPHPDSFIIKLEKDRDRFYNLHTRERDLRGSTGDPDTIH